MTFNIMTLGCKVNSYESNVMRDLLKSAGYTEVGISDAADISIINTCSVTNTADSKSLKVIRQVHKKNPNAIIVACGCMIQNKKDEIFNINEISIAFGNVGKSKIVDYIEEYKKTGNRIIDIKDVMDSSFEKMSLNTFDKTRAYVKIEDGCENYCSYCIIPYTRGKVRSKDPREVIEEVKKLVSCGHKEIVLTGIHTGHYGFKDFNFADLLNYLVEIDGLERLRISSIEMNEITHEVLEVFKKSNVLVDHIHLPLQSGSNSVLKRMNRKYLKEDFIDKVNEIRSVRPNISITTDVIVGFPEETNDEFNETVETIKKINFSKIHVFPYSVRVGTPAEKMHQVDGNVKKERVQILLNLSKELEQSYFEKYVGSKVVFIPEVYKDGFLIGHTGNYLLVKSKGSESELHKDKEAVIEEIKYPYCIAKELNN
ncbi:MAG: tRNA (N(6)-L-threonylcarbamoyladenosine(37)-C(2))-methylthiotransferase MtaB [Bacilli bacterium]|nr:tRNA (N(6)-L-threonylcarbamoyladenosine(37)-C(2))-methylthiotransferase MtaB [Bacilli bacterium]